jgi:hypothetical protein
MIIVVYCLGQVDSYGFTETVEAIWGFLKFIPTFSFLFLRPTFERTSHFVGSTVFHKDVGAAFCE